MKNWKVVKKGEDPEVEFTIREEWVRCDRCGRIVPERYTERFLGVRDGHHDGREGFYIVCRDVWGMAGTGKIHEACK